MKNEKRQQAKNLYFQTDLSKTEIASLLDVNRRTIYLWVREGNWDRIRSSGDNTPAILTEYCYYMMAHLSHNVLSDARGSTFPVTQKEADTMHKLALTISKIRNRQSLNESIEMFTFFLEKLKKKDPALAQSVLPHIDEHINDRGRAKLSDFPLPSFGDDLTLHNSQHPIDLTEQRLDEQTAHDLETEHNNAA